MERHPADSGISESTARTSCLCLRPRATAAPATTSPRLPVTARASRRHCVTGRAPRPLCTLRDQRKRVGLPLPGYAGGGAGDSGPCVGTAVAGRCPALTSASAVQQNRPGSGRAIDEQFSRRFTNEHNPSRTSHGSFGACQHCSSARGGALTLPHTHLPRRTPADAFAGQTKNASRLEAQGLGS